MEIKLVGGILLLIKKEKDAKFLDKSPAPRSNQTEHLQIPEVI